MNYLRKIIYLNEYHGGEYGSSIGFVKLSKKQTRLRIEIQLTAKISLHRQKIYLLIKNKNVVNKMFADTVTEEGTRIDISLEQPAEDTLKGDIIGIIIGTENEIICGGTQDHSINLLDYVHPEKVRAAAETPEDISEEAPDKIPKLSEQKPEEAEMISEETVSEETVSEKTVSEGTISKELVPEEQRIQETSEVLPEDRRVDGQEIQQETRPEVQPEAAEPEEEEEEIVQIEIEADHDEAYEFRKIFSSHPGMYPFDDDEMEVCVQISPVDFSDFPKAFWRMGSNSFLLQGYYNYRHLLLSHTKEKIYIGIPGQYHRRDKYLADMFGFGRFKGIHNKQIRLGDFGYWMMEFDMPQSTNGGMCCS